MKSIQRFKIDLHILIIHLYTKFQFKISIYDGDNERKQKIIGITKSKGHNSAKNYATRPIFELNLRNLVTHLYTEF